jgi:rSAM/selenodomain-associated transferase 2
MKASIIIPALNDREQLRSTLPPLQRFRSAGHEVILVDGGSADDTRSVAEGKVDLLLSTGKGRAVQMNEGARHATGEILLFLHADTRLGDEAMAALLDRFPAGGKRWGRFDVRLSGSRPMLRVVETMINLRSRLTGIATGDQGIFTSRKAFESVGGYREMPLMEDIALSRSLKRSGRPLCIGTPLVTSSRRWEEKGIWRTILLMWRLRLAFALGADPRELAKRYDP